jgi:hypothetical protein
MNDFLKEIWLDNSVQSYLIVAGIILFVLLLKTIYLALPRGFALPAGT